MRKPDLHSLPEGGRGDLHGSVFVQSLEEIGDALISLFKEFL